MQIYIPNATCSPTTFGLPKTHEFYTGTCRSGDTSRGLAHRGEGSLQGFKSAKDSPDAGVAETEGGTSA